MSLGVGTAFHAFKQREPRSNDSDVMQMNRHFAHAVALGVAVFVASGCGVATDDVASRAVGSSDPHERCTVERAPGGGTGTDDRGAEAPYSEVLARYFGTNVKSRLDTLRKGLLGTVSAKGGSEFVVVVDPDRVDVEGVQADLEAVSPRGQTVRVQAGCHSAGDLLSVYEAVASGADGADHASGWSIEPADSTLHVTFPRDQAAAAARLQGRHGRLLTVELVDGQSVLD